MSGAYTHITVENFLKEPMRLEAIEGFPEDGIITVLDYFKFCELGAVSPDYPYLALDDLGAAEWADSMHYTRTGQMIHEGIRFLRETEGEAKQKGLAWLLGYSAHVATDMTIHPVVQMKVGPYHENKSGHRTCEMNQDSYIFQRLNLGGIGLSDHLSSGIGLCSDPDNPDILDLDVHDLWEKMLQQVYPDDFEQNPPDIHKWHIRFNAIVSTIASAGNILMPLARHVAAEKGLVYPLKDEIDMQYIEDLPSPESPIHFDDLFDRALKNVEWMWSLVTRGVLENDDECFEKVTNWNLDTGRDENDQLIFWEE
ncbi:Phospholipase domain-containing protein [Desulfonema limicola]|uniref:Phospholipase domain-containing protein n=1 Tax=Desulfonema limicola TaxID=45656 RepID=A0A975GJG0_9BACT|nr:zinc dependent phospholipase C family protein [Desulfonema limicola]QTA83681.1 Phospholipase domain-containing protein [Desulfonema limicola]